MHTIQRGNAAEAAVLAALVAADIPVLVPFGDGLPFDLAAVIPPHGEMVRIQVKSGRVRSGCILFNACSTDHGKGRRPYRELADLIAAYVRELRTVYVVAVDDCPGYVCSLRLDPPLNNQRMGVRFAKDYTLEAWLSRLESNAAPVTRAVLPLRQTRHE
jgi:PD-(D/E)XK endonuclease